MTDRIKAFGLTHTHTESNVTINFRIRCVCVGARVHTAIVSPYLTDGRGFESAPPPSFAAVLMPIGIFFSCGPYRSATDLQKSF